MTSPATPLKFFILCGVNLITTAVFAMGMFDIFYAGDSCMVELMTRSGIPRGSALTYEITFRQLWLTADKIVKSETSFLAFAMKFNIRHATALQQCLRKY